MSEYVPEFSDLSEIKTYYKYRPLHSVGEDGTRKPHSFTQSIFEEKELWYSAPKDFNDPFDCNLKLHFSGSTDEDWDNYMTRLIEEHPEHKEKLERTRKTQEWNKESNFSDGFGDNILKSNYHSSSVFCFSKKCDSVPMFSYYADSHQGIAIGFSFSQQEIPCGFKMNQKDERGVSYAGKIVYRRVEYQKRLPELNYHRLINSDPDELVRSIIFTKQHDWKHEEEFRIFRRNVSASAVQFPESLLTRVVFGCRTSEEDVDLVKSWLSDWPSEVILAKAKQADNSFDLEVKEIGKIIPH